MPSDCSRNLLQVHLLVFSKLCQRLLVVLMLIQQPSVLAVDRKVYVRNTIFIYFFFSLMRVMIDCHRLDIPGEVCSQCFLKDILKFNCSYLA